MKTAKNIEDARFKEDGGFSVDEMKSGSGTPSSDPVKRSFQWGSPGCGEDGERVALGSHGLDSVVIRVVGHDGLDEMVGGRGGVVVVFGGGGELVDEAVEMVEPGGVEAGEIESAAAHLGTHDSKAEANWKSWKELI